MPKTGVSSHYTLTHIHSIQKVFFFAADLRAAKVSHQVIAGPQKETNNNPHRPTIQSCQLATRKTHTLHKILLLPNKHAKKQSSSAEEPSSGPLTRQPWDVCRVLGAGKHSGRCSPCSASGDGSLPLLSLAASRFWSQRFDSR